MKLSDDVIASINENGVDVSSAWMWADVDIYNIGYGAVLVQPVSVEAATLNDFRFLAETGTITVRQTIDPDSMVIWSGYVEMVSDPAGDIPETVAVDHVTIDWNVNNELEVKDGGITASKIADGTITDSKLADMPAGMVKGRAVGAGTGPVTNLSTADVHTIIGRGVANGVASLGANGKVPRSESSDIILSGVVEAVLPELTINEGAGSITVPALRIQAFDNPDYLGYPERYTTVETVLYPTTGTQQYVVFTQATGLVSLISSAVSINISNVIPLYVVSKVGTTIHSIGFDTMGHGLPQKNEVALLNTTPYRRSTGGGLSLSADTALHLSVSASVVYAGTTPVNVLAYNSSTDTLTQCYHVAGVWTYSSASHTYNNTQYDNGTNLVTLGSNKYKWVWCFRSIGDSKEVFYVNGSADYSTPTAANTEKMPAVPPVVGWHCILVGRILIQQGQTTPYDVQSAFDQTFQSSQIQEHNNLSGIQGGAAGDYQHLTTAQVTSFTNKPTSVFGRTGAVVAAAGDYTTSLVPEGTNLYYTDSRADARITLQKGVAGGIASLDVGGKVPIAQIPASAITETFVVASEAAMLALTAQRGDVAVRTDNHTSYILQADPASTLANWVELLSPADGVTSVGLSAPSGFTVSGSPVTNSGTLSFAWNGTSSNFVRADGSTVATSSYLSAAGNPDLVAIEALAGTSGLLKKTAANTWTLDTNTYLTGNQNITLSGEASGAGATSINVTLSNSSVIGKVLTGYTATSGTISATDTILQAIQKLGFDKHVAVTIGTANGLSLSGQAISLGLASTSTTGALSSTNWNTFNNKQAGSSILTSISALTTGTGLLKLTNGVASLDTNSYLTGNQTITLTGIVTGSGTTAITTAIADGALSIAKTSGLQTALDGKQPLDADLTAISALTTTGFARRTAADTWSASGIVWADVSGLAGTSATSFCVGNDSRLSNARTPTAHVLDSAIHTISGKTAGQALIATGATTFAFTTISGDATLSGTGAVTLANTAVTAGSYGSSTQVGTITVDSKGRITGASNTSIAFPVTSVFGRTGAVVAASGDYTTSQVTEGTNLYFTEARVLGTDLAGYAVGSNTALAATDTILGAFGKVQGQLNAKLNSSSYTAADVLAKLLTVDGTGSDLSADSLRGNLKTMSLNSAATSTGTWKQIAVLSASGSGNFDVVYLDLVQHAWIPTNGNTRRAQMTFRNRDSFVAKFWTYGDWSGSGRVQAYQDAGGTTSIYLYIPSSYWVIEAQVLVERASFGNETVITTAPTGTLLWDSGTATADYTSMTTQSYPDLVAIEALAGTSGFLKKTAANTWALDTNTYLTGNQTITLSGDASGSGTTAIAVTNNKIDVTEHSANNTNYPVVWDNTSRQLFHTASKLLFNPSTGTLTSTAFSGPLTGNASTATTWQTARTLTIGNTGKSVNGSANVSWSLAEIGAQAALGYTPINKAGDSGIAALTFSDNIYFANPTNGTYRGIQGTMGANDQWRVMGRADADNAGFLEIATSDDGTEPIYVRQYNAGTFGTLVRSASLLDGSGNTSFPGSVTAGNGFVGNASTATKLATARTLTVGSTGKTFDGSANVSWTLAEIGAQASLGYTPVNKAGDSDIGSLTLSYGKKLKAGVDVQPSTSGNNNYNDAPIIAERAATSGTTYAAGIGFHNRGVNAAFLYYDPATSVYKYNRNSGAIRTIWDDGNLTNLNQLTNGPGYLTASALASVNYGTTFESTDPFASTNRGTYDGKGGVRTWNGAGPFGSVWYNVVDVRHRNAWNTNDVFGGELAWGMTAYTDRLAFRSRSSTGVPGSWSEVAVLGKDVSFNTINTTSNNAGNNIKIGDDAWIGDQYVTNGIIIKGQTDATQGYIKFGNSAYSFGYNGSELVYNGNRVLNAADVTALNIPYYNGTSGLASDNSFRLSSSGGSITELHLGSSANVQTFLSLYGNFTSILNFDVGNALRFQVGATPTYFAIDARDASGTYIDTPISIGNASTSFVTFNRKITAPYISASSSDIGIMSGTSLTCSGTVSGDLVAERLLYQNGTGTDGVVFDVNGSGGQSLPTGQPTGTVLVYAGQMNIQTDTITIPSGEALWYRSQAGGSNRVVGPSSISVNRQCITVIKFANEWRVNGLLYV